MGEKDQEPEKENKNVPISSVGGEKKRVLHTPLTDVLQ